jgi:hypothetical protein
MIVNARFVCQTVTSNGYDEKINMHSIWTGHPEDNSYSEATPNGSFEIYVTNKALHGHFQPGEVYDFKITHHEKSS